MKSPLFIFVVVLVLSLLAAAPIAAAPIHAAAPRGLAASPCTAGGGYSPSCDVNHDGVVNVLDIQLTAGHWNQTGVFLSNNDHTHLGQTWLGASNPLKIQGAFGAPDYAPLVLNNTAGVGLRIAASDSAVYIDSAGDYGLWVSSAGDSGVRVDSAGYWGVRVDSVGSEGVLVGSAGGSGVVVQSASWTGVYANTTQGNGQWGFHTPDGIRGSNVLLHSLSLVAQVTGLDNLTPGDLVAVTGVADPVPGTTVHTPLVRLAGGTFANVVGVVESHLAFTQQPSRPQSAEGETDIEAPPPELRSVAGPAQAGDYIAITVLGAVQVKVQDGEAIQPGQRLTVADTPGHARALRTVQVEGIRVDESGPTLGVALEAPKDGLVWVLVNPQ